MNIKTFSETISADFCVVGGGMSGICAAVAAGRHGVKTVLVQDRPVLGGNASSEIRMWICGAHGKDNKEGGILEEIMLYNYRWNPSLNYYAWDQVLKSFVEQEPNIKLLLNTSCHEVKAEGNIIRNIKAWQLSSQIEFTIEAKYFADCSGDSVLRFSGAEFRSGREGKSEFNESYAPEKADNKTMGNSILMQLKESSHHKPFVMAPWAHKFTENDLAYRDCKNLRDNFWWMEYGGIKDSIRDAEAIRDELVKIAYGVWGFIKNHPDGRAKNYDLEWIGALPGKRENIRYIGDHILTQNDIDSEGRFDDIVAYGGWSMDDHNPDAFYHKGEPTIFYPAKAPFGIPFRSLYSKNISNLYFAGRNISATHMGMSATRVMGTCAMMGQAVGTAAAMSVKYSMPPREIHRLKIKELQKILMDDDVYLPWHKRANSELADAAELKAETAADVLRNGIERNLNEVINSYSCRNSSPIEYSWKESHKIKSVRIVLDSYFKDRKRMPCFYPASGWNMEMPKTLVKKFSLEIRRKSSSPWEKIYDEAENIKRLVTLKIDEDISAIRLIPEENWGNSSESAIFAFDVSGR